MSVKSLGSDRGGGGLPSGLGLLTVCQDMRLFQTILVGLRKWQDSGRSTNLKTSPVRTDKLIDLNSILGEEESGHGTDAQLSSNVGDFVDVHLEESNTLNLARESLEVWSNQFARPYGWCQYTVVSIITGRFVLVSLTTPSCVAVDDDDLVLDGVLIILGILRSVSILQITRGRGFRRCPRSHLLLDDVNHVHGCVMEVFGKSLLYRKVKWGC